MLVGYGLTQEQVAHCMNIAPNTLAAMKERDQRVFAALEKGLAVAASFVGQALFTKAKQGDVGAIVWWEKTRAGRREPKQEIQAQNSNTIRVIRE